MNGPQVKVLGVYRLPLTEELFRLQFSKLYGYPMSKAEHAQAERWCREQLSSVVLVEAMVRNRDDTFDVGEFVQPQEGVPAEDWQVAWAEAYLTLDGEALAVERWADPPPSGDLRIAFFMHYWQSDKPLYSSYGEVPCPTVKEMPERLARLVPYEPVD
jgi:hypothetical protein